MNFKDAFEYVLKNVNLGFGSKGMRIILTICVVIALVSGMRLITEKNYLSAQVVDIQKQFIQKNKPLMLEVLSNCQGDLSNRDVVQACLYEKQNQMLSDINRKLIVTKLTLLAWMVWWALVIGAYVLLVHKQKIYRKAQSE